MLIVADTNVLFSALHSSRGASHRILRLILDEDIALAVTNAVYFEYRDVLTRSETLAKLDMSADDVMAVLDALGALAMKQTVYFRLRPNLLDESDNMFAECALVSHAELLVTHNTRHFRNSELRGFQFRIVTPSEFLCLWREDHGR